jgi:hypothetical protein
MASIVFERSFNNLTPAATYSWNLPAPSAITLYKNISKAGVGFIYNTDANSDAVVIRCPLNDTLIQKNNTYVCWLLPGESSKIELKSPYYYNGASGTYALIF